MPGHSAQGPVSPCPCRHLYFCVLVAAVPVSEVVSRCRFDSHSLGTGGVQHLSVGSLAQAARAPPQPGDSHSHQHALRFTSLDVGLWVRIPRTPRAHASLASEGGGRRPSGGPLACALPAAQSFSATFHKASGSPWFRRLLGQASHLPSHLWTSHLQASPAPRCLSSPAAPACQAWAPSPP